VRRLILASASPRRRELLGGLGLEFEVVPAEGEELLPEAVSPREAALSLARQKGLEVAARHPAAWVLSADTVVAVGGEVLGKPRDSAEALAMLKRLSGREHTVITAFCLLCREAGRERCAAVETEVVFRAVPEAELAAYAHSNEPLDKAGGYAIQGGAAAFVAKTSGSYSNVVGLPLERLSEALRAEGLLSAGGGVEQNETAR
jgi:septum formation protein